MKSVSIPISRFQFHRSRTSRTSRTLLIFRFCSFLPPFAGSLCILHIVWALATADFLLFAMFAQSLFTPSQPQQQPQQQPPSLFGQPFGQQQQQPQPQAQSSQPQQQQTSLFGQPFGQQQQQQQPQPQPQPQPPQQQNLQAQSTITNGSSLPGVFSSLLERGKKRTRHVAFEDPDLPPLQNGVVELRSIARKLAENVTAVDSRKGYCTSPC